MPVKLFARQNKPNKNRDTNLLSLKKKFRCNTKLKEMPMSNDIIKRSATFDRGLHGGVAVSTVTSSKKVPGWNPMYAWSLGTPASYHCSKTWMSG